MPVDEDFLRCYFDELSYLRGAGRDFARTHQRVAGRLDMPHGESSDPHVERLIESFAFLTGRLQRQMRAEFPEITTALLGVLYPQLLQPIPPMAIACFDVGNAIRGLTSGFRVPRLTPLFAQDAKGVACRFQTCYATTLWPVTVAYAALESANHHNLGYKDLPVLRVRLKVPQPDLLPKPEFLPRLRFFLDGPPELTGALYDLLFGSLVDVAVSDQLGDDNAKQGYDKARPRAVLLGPGALEEVGFGEDEAVLRYPANALPAYRLLQEYFNCRQKFLFLDISGLAKRNCAAAGNAADTLDLFFVLSGLPSPPPAIGAENFRLGCTPIVNLFAKTTEPIRLDHMQLEYRLLADLRRETTTEIHSILSVSASSNPDEPSRRYEPFYSFRHRYASAEAGTEGEPRAFWLSRRVTADRADLKGTDIYLSFLDLDMDPAMPSDQTVFAHTLCTNRWLAAQMPDRAQLHIEGTTPVLRIVCVTKPTMPAYPPTGGRSLWRLVSSLTLNSASLTQPAAENGSGPEEAQPALDALKEILRLYSFTENTIAGQEIDGITAMGTRKVLRRFGPDAWRGIRRGTEIALTFDKDNYKGGSALLMASVLRRFFGLYGSVNAFTEVVARREHTDTDKEWKRWRPLAGAREVL